MFFPMLASTHTSLHANTSKVFLTPGGQERRDWNRLPCAWEADIAKRQLGALLGKLDCTAVIGLTHRFFSALKRREDELPNVPPEPRSVPLGGATKVHSLDLTSCLLSLRRLSPHLFPVFLPSLSCLFCFMCPSSASSLLPRFVGNRRRVRACPTLTLTPTVWSVSLASTRSLGCL